MSFLPTFDERWAPVIGVRAATFRAAIAQLEQQITAPCVIAETGAMREEPNTINALSDGSSTMLWDEVANHHDATVRVFELDHQRCLAVAKHVSARVTIHGGDAVRRLRELPIQSVDLLYLDSYDVEWHNPHPSALHHLMELVSAMPAMKPSGLILIDDCGDSGGKGLYVAEYMSRANATLLARGYQHLWRLP